MKKCLISLLCLLINFGICCSAEFKDLSLSQAVKQSGKLYEYELETFSDDPTLKTRIKYSRNFSRSFREIFLHTR